MEAFGNVEAVAIRQHDIGEEQIEAARLPLEDFDRLGHARRRQDLIAGVTEQFEQREAYGVIVFQDEDAFPSSRRYGRR